MYTINYKIIKKNIGFFRTYFIVGLLILILEVAYFGIESIVSPLLMFMLLPIGFIILGIIGMKKNYNKLKKTKHLNKIGVLFKNVPYVLEKTGMKVNNVWLKKPIVNFMLDGGVELRLEGDPRHDTASVEKNGLIDVIIDPNDTNNYYIDFNINRIDGNRPEDYYKTETQTQQQGQLQQENQINYVKPL